MGANIMSRDREIIFYETENGKIPVKEFLDQLEFSVVRKVLWTLTLIREQEFVPSSYFKKLEAVDGIWEVRVNCGSKIKATLLY